VDAETADVVGMSTEQLRDSFLIADIFGAGELRGVFTALDRLVVGGAMRLRPCNYRTTPRPGGLSFWNGASSARSTSVGRARSR